MRKKLLAAFVAGGLILGFPAATRRREQSALLCPAVFRKQR